MNMRILKVAVILILGCSLIIAFGCILNPKDDKVLPKPPVLECKSLTDKENVLNNMMYAYAAFNTECYDALLDEGYFFYLQEEDVLNGLPPQLERAEDFRITKKMFDIGNNVLEPDPIKKEPDIMSLNLKIYYANWAAADSVNSQPCTDCWQTDREYELTLDTGENQYYAHYRSLFIVKAVEEDGETHYKLAAQYDTRQ